MGGSDRVAVSGSGARGRQIICVAKSATPMTEIRADNKDAAGIREVWRQQSAVSLFGPGTCRADENRDERWEQIGRGEGAREEFIDVREVHFEAVFILVGRAGHFGKQRGCMESGNQRGVECERTKRSCILSTLGEGTAGQVKVVRGAEKENSFPRRSRGHRVRMGEIETAEEEEGNIRFGEVERLVGPCCRGARICISSVPTIYQSAPKSVKR